VPTRNPSRLLQVIDDTGVRKGGTPYPGVLQKVVKLNGLHSVAMRKVMKTQGALLCIGDCWRRWSFMAYITK
jgi:hypothetical protein